jgi:5,10-methylenetetrahydromethanopterin reductase
MSDAAVKGGGVSFGVCRPARLDEDLASWAELSQSIGAELIGFGDSQTMWGDPYVAMTLAADHTTTPRIGPVVTVPVTRHPTVAASAIAGIQEVSNGRAFFAIGPGDSALFNVGEKNLGLAGLAEYAMAVQGLCAGHEVHYAGRRLKLNYATRPVPLWLAGDGPKMLELGGRIGDGVIVGNGATPGLVQFARRNIDVGARSVGRTVDDLDVWYMVRVHLARTESQGMSELAFYLASYANVRFRKSMHDKGIDVSEDMARRITAFRSEFAGSQAYDPRSTHNTDLLDKYELRQWLADQFLVTGPLEVVVQKLRDLVDAGARKILVPQMLPDAMTTTAQLGPIFESLR